MKKEATLTFLQERTSIVYHMGHTGNVKVAYMTLHQAASRISQSNTGKADQIVHTGTLKLTDSIHPSKSSAGGKLP